MIAPEPHSENPSESVSRSPNNLPRSAGQDGRAVARQNLPGPPRLPRTPDALSLLQAFRHRWVLALSLSLLAGIVGAAATWYWLPRAKTQYRAYALLRIAAAPQRVAFPTTIEDKGDFLVYRQTQAELMRSRFVLRSALNFY